MADAPADDDARREASDPTTPPERLQALAESPDEAIRVALAHNPAAPLAVMLTLLERHVPPVLDNPALDLHLLIDPLLLRSLSLTTRWWLARQPLRPTVCAALLRDSLEVRTLLARHQRIDDSIARDLLTDLVGAAPGSPAERLADALAGNPTKPAWALREAAQRVGLRQLPARSPELCAELIALMARSELDALRALAAAEPGASEPLLLQLAQDDSSSVRRAVATNAGASAAVLERLLRDPSAAVRRAVGRNPGTTRWMLQALARDPSAFVHERPRQRLRHRGSGW